MRISDWSSDVCSSDLSHIEARCATFRTSTGAVDPETVAITNTRPCASTLPKHHSRSYGTYTVWASGKSAALAPGTTAHQEKIMPEILSWPSTHRLPHTRATKLVLQAKRMRVLRRRYDTGTPR